MKICGKLSSGCSRVWAWQDQKKARDTAATLTYLFIPPSSEINLDTNNYKAISCYIELATNCSVLRFKLLQKSKWSAVLVKCLSVRDQRESTRQLSIAQSLAEDSETVWIGWHVTESCSTTNWLILWVHDDQCKYYYGGWLHILSSLSLSLSLSFSLSLLSLSHQSLTHLMLNLRHWLYHQYSLWAWLWVWSS